MKKTIRTWKVTPTHVAGYTSPYFFVTTTEFKRGRAYQEAQKIAKEVNVFGEERFINDWYFKIKIMTYLIKEGDSFTVVTRSDLTPGYKVAQSCHAVAEFGRQYPQQFLDWQCKSNFICCLEASEIKIGRLLSRLDELKIKYSVFLEPDIGNEMTAVAVEALPKELHKKLFKNLKLTLS